MFVFKNIKIGKELSPSSAIFVKEVSTPLAISLIPLSFFCMLIYGIQTLEPSDVHYEHSTITLPSKKKESVPEYKSLPSSRSTFHIFKEVLAHRESGGKYSIVNKLGYLGKYQFGKSTLDVLGIQNTNFFLKSPILQEMAFILNVSRNKWILRREIHSYSGHRINGVLITESGIIAAAHLSGPGNVKKYLRSSGGNNVKDAFGTSLQNYMKNFGGYNISSIPAVRNPRL